MNPVKNPYEAVKIVTIVDKLLNLLKLIVNLQENVTERLD